jgi:hypothetical protein
MLCKYLKQMARQRRKGPFRCLTTSRRVRRHIVRMSFLVQSTDMTDCLGLHTANHSAAKMAFIIGGSFTSNYWGQHVPVAARLKVGSAAARLLGFWVRMPPGHGIPSLLSVVYCLAEVSTSGWSLVCMNPIECGVSEYDRETLIMRRPWLH